MKIKFSLWDDRNETINHIINLYKRNTHLHETVWERKINSWELSTGLHMCKCEYV